jgi:uncharacterized protein
MSTHPSTSWTAFLGQKLIATGALADVALAVKRVSAQPREENLFVFDDATGRVIDIDTRGSDADIVARFSQTAPEASVSEEPRGRGRPKLGVVAREVTLLPRHWEWLAEQRGGASVALRRLVDEARRASVGKDRRRAAQDGAYRFMSGMAGDLVNFEEAIRALYAGEGDRFAALIVEWPADVRDYASKLAAPVFVATPEPESIRPSAGFV